MSLTLTIIDTHQLLPDGDTVRTLDQGTLAIGRARQNDWVLPDPERIISSQHCAIEAVDGRFVLTDTSSNGVFLNDSDKAIGKGNTVTLGGGDRVRIGHFRIDVTLDAQAGLQAEANGASAAPTPPPAAGPDPFGADPFAADPIPGAAPSPNLDAILDPTSSSGSAQQESNGPFPGPAQQIIGSDDELFGPPGGGASSDPFGGPETTADPSYHETMGEPASDQEFFQPPKALPEIPDDWDDNLSGAPSQGAPLPVESPPPAAAATQQTIPDDPFADPAPMGPTAAPPPAATPSSPVAPPVPGAPAGGAREMLDAFLAGAQLEDVTVPDDDALETMRMLGGLYRETVQSLMEVLSARSSVKSEFRLSQTVIQPIENNPLKFSLGASDAMTALLTKKGRDYLSADRALGEAFDDIKAHQVAVMVGMQEAISGLLKRFDPAAIENRIDGGGKSRGLSLKNKDARNWEEFTRLFETLAAEAEDDFHSLFGREFAKAYEGHVNKLRRRGEDEF